VSGQWKALIRMSFCYEQQIYDPTFFAEGWFFITIVTSEDSAPKETVLRLWDTELVQLCGQNFLYACALQRQLPFCHSEGTHGGY